MQKTKKRFATIKIESDLAEKFRDAAYTRGIRQSDYLRMLLSMDEINRMFDGSPIGNELEKMIKNANKLLEARQSRQPTEFHY